MRLLFHVGDKANMNSYVAKWMPTRKEEQTTLKSNGKHIFIKRSYNERYKQSKWRKKLQNSVFKFFKIGDTTNLHASNLPYSCWSSVYLLEIAMQKSKERQNFRQPKHSQKQFLLTCNAAWVVWTRTWMLNDDEEVFYSRFFHNLIPIMKPFLWSVQRLVSSF